MRFVQSPSASTPNTKASACKLRPSVPPASNPRRSNGPVAIAEEGGDVAEVTAAALQTLVPKP